MKYLLRLITASLLVVVALTGCGASKMSQTSGGNLATSSVYGVKQSQNASESQTPTDQPRLFEQSGTRQNNISIPPFQGTVSYANVPLLNISSEEWEKAKQDFQFNYPRIKDAMDTVKSSDFVLTGNWQGVLNNRQFILNLYSLQAQFLLVVSKYGDDPVKVKIFGGRPSSAFAFYEDNVWLMVQVKGVGESLNIVTGELEKSTPQLDNLNLEFDRMSQKLSKISPEKRLVGAKLQIDGHNLVVVHDMVVAVIDKL